MDRTGVPRILTLPVAFVILALYAYFRPPTVHDPVADPWQLASYAAGAFIFGAVCCGMSPFDATKGLGSPCI